MKTVDSFLKGYKPAFLEIPDIKWTTKHLDFLLENYPYVSEHDYALLFGNRFYLFFQNELTQALFHAEIKRSTFSKEEVDRILGTVLGFPPKAIEFYVRMMKEERKGNLEGYQQMKDRKIGIIYSGCSFSSDIDDFKVNALWLLEKYPYEEAKEDGMFVRVGGERLPVPIGNYRQLTEFHEYILQKSGAVPV